MTTTTEHQLQKLPQLSSDNFSNWKFRLNCILEEKKLLNVTKKEKLENDDKEHDCKAKSLIVQCVPDKYLDIVKDAATSSQMLEKLTNLFERRSIFTKLHLRRKLLSMKMEDENIEEYFAKFEKLTREIDNMDKKMAEEDRVCYLLIGLPERYNTVITAIETLGPDRLNYEFVKARLLDEELKMTSRQIELPIETVLHTQKRNTGTNNNVVCYRCNKKGHFANTCQQRQNHQQMQYLKNNNSNQSCGQTQSNYTQAFNGNIDIEDWSLVALNANEEYNVMQTTNDKTNKQIKFIIDSGSTEHLVNDTFEKYMYDVTKLEKPTTIRIANGDFLESEKRGKIKLISNGKKMSIECLVIKGICQNLLSVARLTTKGFTIKFTDSRIELSLNKETWISTRKGHLYFLEGDIIRMSENCYTTLSDDKDLWHKRLGHLSRKGLNIMKLPSSDKPCEPCMIGKATRLPFKTVIKAKSYRVGDLIHTDVGGPINIPTHEGFKYFMTVIDDYSHYTTVFLLRNKSEAGNRVIDYINKFETEKETTIRRIRCDNGGEYTSNMLKNFCNTKGIKIEYTLPHSSQQNGTAERMNRTIFNKVRTILCESNLPKHLWGEALQCSVYLINRNPSIQNRIPARIFNKDLMLDRLRVFGAKGWQTIVPRHGKLDARAIPVRMVGYRENGYRVWDPETNKVSTSRDLKFDENDIRYEPCTKDYENQNEIISYESEEEPAHTERDDQNAQHDKMSERPRRTVRPPQRYDDYETFFDTDETNIAYAYMAENDPETYEQAMQESDEWKEAISKELSSMKAQKVWTECVLPKGKKAIDTRWIFRTKPDGTKKGRLVARGFQQEINSYDIYAPVIKMTTVRMCLSQAIMKSYQVIQLDIPTAFLNGYLESEVYIKVPKGLEIKDQTKVLKLEKALYGLKEAPRCWNKRFDEFCEKINMRRSRYDVCLYIGENIWLMLFVDDILLIGEDKKIEDIVESLKDEFNAKDMGNASTYLGIDIKIQENTLQLSQTRFIDKLLHKFNMSESKVIRTPMEVNFSNDSDIELKNVPYRELIGTLTYLSMTTRPDITYATSYLSRFLDKPSEAVWQAAKRVLKYLKGTANLCLTYKKREVNLLAFSDADWAGDRIDRKSTSGLVVYHGPNLVSWASKKQSLVALSTAEAEYVAAAYCTAELLYIKGLCSEFNNECCAELCIDNQSAIQMISNYENSKRSKHIDIKVHFIRDVAAKKMISLKYVTSEDNVADIMTKALCPNKFAYLREKMFF